MPSLTSVSRGVARIAFRRGSPQRIPYSSRLTVGALLAWLALTVASQVYVFGSDVVGTCLYVFTALAGLYLGTALLSRRTPPARLRASLQAAVLLLAVAHLLLLFMAPLAAGRTWLPFTTAAVLAGVVAMGLTNCVQFALSKPRPIALGVTLAFLLIVAAFYTTMHMLLAIAMA